MIERAFVLDPEGPGHAEAWAIDPLVSIISSDPFLTFLSEILDGVYNNDSLNDRARESATLPTRFHRLVH